MGVVGKEERNIITLSLVHVFSFNPPLIGVGISPSRHSHELFHRSPDFSINIPPKELVEESIFCGEKSGKDMDKFEETGLTAVPGKKIGTPIIEECLVNLSARRPRSSIPVTIRGSWERWCARRRWRTMIGNVRSSTGQGEFRTVGEIIRGR